MQKYENKINFQRFYNIFSQKLKIIVAQTHKNKGKMGTHQIIIRQSKPYQPQCLNFLDLDIYAT